MTGTPVRGPVVAHELQDVLDRVQLRHLAGSGTTVMFAGRRTVARRPPRLIDQQRAVLARAHSCGDFGQVQAHALCVTPRLIEQLTLLSSAAPTPRIGARSECLNKHPPSGLTTACCTNVAW